MTTVTVTYQLRLTLEQREQLRDILIREIIDARERLLAAPPKSRERAKYSMRYMAAHQLFELLALAPF